MDNAVVDAEMWLLFRWTPGRDGGGWSLGRLSKHRPPRKTKKRGRLVHAVQPVEHPQEATFEIEWVGYDSGSDYKLSLTNCCDSLAEAQDSDCARGKFIFLKRVEHV